MPPRFLISFLRAEASFARAYTKRTGVNPDALAIQRALCTKLGLQDTTQLAGKEWSTAEIEALIGDQRLDADVCVPLEVVELKRAIFPPELPRLLTEEEVKFDSEVWVIHKNDVDPFPSIPHAHCQGSPTKLDLGTGVLYSGRDAVGTIRWKHLKELRSRIKYRPLPPLDKVARNAAL